WWQLPDQPQLFERGLELRAEHAPLDPVQSEKRGLDRWSLAFASEVGAQARAQVAGPADVEHLLVPVMEQVDTGPARRPMRQRALAIHTPLARRGRREQFGEPPRTDLLRESDQPDEHLGGGLGIG